MDGTTFKGKKIVFLGNIEFPSSFMRGYQMAQYLSSIGIPAVYTNNPQDVENAIVIVAKQSDLISRIKNGNIIILDIIDYLCHRNVSTLRTILPRIHGIIVPNKSAHAEILKIIDPKKTIPVRVIHHHWDPRIRDIVQTFKPNPSTLCIGYVGDYGSMHNGLEHAYELVKNHQVLLIDTNTGKERSQEFLYDKKNKPVAFDSTSIMKLTDLPLNMHINVRPPGSLQFLYKPGIKVSTAAAMNCNIITTKDSSLMELLPPDYPYLLKDANLGTITEMIRYARSTFGTDVWKKASLYMKKVTEETSIENIAKHYISFLSEYV